jgi:hypothetical protein
MAETQETWHRGSRFYRLGGHALYLAATFVYLSMYFQPEVVTEAFGVFGGICMLLLGGSTWTNLKERDISRAQVQAGVPITGEEGL